jgi:NTP pyrophosphatase (non-canonical NTP hydrolase)
LRWENPINLHHLGVKMTEGISQNNSRPVDVDSWLASESGRKVLAVDESGVADILCDGTFTTMMGRVARFHDKHKFADNNGHDMGYRLTLMIEELGELAAAVTKGKPQADLEEELADVFILTLGNALSMEIDLEKAFHKKLDKVMMRKAITGRLGVRVTEYDGN